MGWTENDLKKNGYLPDGTGNFRAMSKREKNVFLKVPSPKSVAVIEFNKQAIDTANPLFIPGDVRSKKNSKQIFINKKTGKPFITSSEQVKEYMRNTQNYYANLRRMFLSELEGKEKPYLIEFHFVFSGKQNRDYGNLCQLPLDMMIEHGLLEDDNMDTVLPVYKPYSIDRYNPGLYIRLLKNIKYVEY